MADNLGPMAWLFLPENVLPQWQQKIAPRAKNPSGPKQSLYGHALFSARSAILCDLLEVTIFRLLARLLRHCLCAAKAVPMNGAPSSNADIAAFRRLPFSPTNQNIIGSNRLFCEAFFCPKDIFLFSGVGTS